jgi:hypothetical protein
MTGPGRPNQNTLSLQEYAYLELSGEVIGHSRTKESGAHQAIDVGSKLRLFQCWMRRIPGLVLPIGNTVMAVLNSPAATVYGNESVILGYH